MNANNSMMYLFLKETRLKHPSHQTRKSIFLIHIKSELNNILIFEYAQYLLLFNKESIFYFACSNFIFCNFIMRQVHFITIL